MFGQCLFLETLIKPVRKAFASGYRSHYLALAFAEAPPTPPIPLPSLWASAPTLGQIHASEVLWADIQSLPWHCWGLWQNQDNKETEEKNQFVGFLILQRISGGYTDALDQQPAAHRLILSVNRMRSHYASKAGKEKISPKFACHYSQAAHQLH